MKNKSLSSRQYAANMFGMGNGDPVKGNKQSKETVTCTKEKSGRACGAERGEVRAGGSVKEGKKSSGTGGERNKVMTRKQQIRRSKEMEAFRAKEKEKHTPKSKY